MSPGGRSALSSLPEVLLIDSEKCVTHAGSERTPGFHSAPAQHSLWDPETGQGRLLSSTEQQGSKATRSTWDHLLPFKAGAGFASLSLSVPIFKLRF